MRTIRRLLRKFLIWLPGGIGETVVLPRVRNAYDKLPLLEWRTKRYCANEARRIQSAISANIDQFTIVFDCKVVIGYGSLLPIILIARHAIAHGIFTNFYVVNTNYTDVDYGNAELGLTQDEIRYCIDDMVDISKVLLDPEFSSVQLISATTLPNVVDPPGNTFLLFDDFTKNRRPFFRDCFNVFNYLMADIPEVLQEQILFSPDDLKSHFPRKFIGSPYISWHCRYSLRGVDFGRQTMPAEFRKCYTYLRDRFPGHKIVIISDSLGCQHYASLAAELQIHDLLFSKEYSSDFLGDAALIINSEFFFSFRGGGIGIIAIHSRIPYECLGPLMNEIFWDEERITPWQGDSQRFIVLEKHQFVRDRSLDLEKIGSAQT